MIRKNHNKVTNCNQIYYIRLFLVSWANFGPANRRSKVLKQRSSSYPGVRGNRNLLLTPTTWSPLATYRNRKSTSGILTCWYQNKMYKIKCHMVNFVLIFPFSFYTCEWLLTHSKLYLHKIFSRKNWMIFTGKGIVFGFCFFVCA